MYTYRINVSKADGTAFGGGPLYRYYFHTEKDNLNSDEAIQWALDLRRRFPASEGFKVELTQWTKPVGHTIPVDDFYDEKGNWTGDVRNENGWTP